MAAINGGSGNDTISGTAGDDWIYGGDGADSVDAGTGDDVVEAGAGANTVEGGAGADRIEGGTGDETLSGGEGADSIHGWDGNDVIDGGADNDTLLGDAGDDTITGGDGDDLIYAEEGHDRIDAGAGADTIYGADGADTFVVGANSSTNTIEDFSAADGDVIAISYPGIASFTDLQPYLSDDGNWGTLISLPDGSVTQVKWLDYGSVSAAQFAFGAAPVCFLRGTLIETAQGTRRVETLGRGDLIRTHDHGWQPLLCVTRSTYRFGPGTHRMKPIRLKPHALARGVPERELRVSPQHRIALPPTAPRMLLPARKLLHLPGVSERPNCRTARYYHLLMERHELVRANGAWAETLLVTETTIREARIPAALQGKARQLARPLAVRAAEAAGGVEA